MTHRIPVAVWRDAEGCFTASVLDGAEAAAIGPTAREACLQLKKYLIWSARRDGAQAADFIDLELRDHRLDVRPEYAVGGASYPVSVPFRLRVACVHGRRRDGTRHCVLPTLGVRLSYQQGDPVDDLIGEAVRQALGKRTPQALSRELMPAALQLAAVHVRQRGAARDNLDDRCPALEAVADPLGRRQRGRAAPRALHREAEVRQLQERLESDAANVLLLGESGVGKTTILIDAIRQVLRKKRPAKDGEDRGDRRTFWRTSGQRTIAGMQYLGQWEERCELAIEDLAECRGILCVENLLELVRVGGCEPGSGVAAFLLPYLQRGELRLVAEATPRELDACRRLLPGLADLFQVVRVEELAPADARGVLEALFDQARRDRKLTVDSGLAEVVYGLFKRFQPHAVFPGRAADFVRRLIDDAEARRAGMSASDVLARFQSETGLPARLLRDDVPLPHAEVLEEFRGAVLGQETACRIAADVVTALKTGLNDPRRPLGVLLFCGPTGVGKTEMAKALARLMFGGGALRDRLVRLDMSEYTGGGAARRLLESPDGGVSDFIKRLRRQPFCVVLLDEIEKAAGEVHDMLLGVLDEGRLTDRFGRTTTFHSAVIVMTSNLGAERNAAIGFDADRQPAFERAALEAFRPEFVNRIDALISFQPLRRETIRALAVRELAALAARDGLTKAGLRLGWSESLVEWLVETGYDARYGARPLQRAVERYVVAPLSRWLLEHADLRNASLQLDLAAGGAIVVRAGE